MTIRIFIGAAANNEDLESQAVLEYTLRKHASDPIDIVWMQLSRNRGSFWYSNSGAGWNTKGWATPFSAFRWAIPAYCGFEGRAIYMDSDMIVRADIAELWRQEMAPEAAVIAKGEGERFCVTLFDCARVKPHMIPLEILRSDNDAYRRQRRMLTGKLVQRFQGNWNCCDGESYASIDDPDIKCLHYTAIQFQPQWRHAVKRLGQQGLKHWYAGEFKPHWRPEIQELFDQMLEEAIAAGYTLDRYEREPFGSYDPDGCHGGGWTKPGAREAAHMGR